MAGLAPKVLLGIGGGIAAYKACSLLRLLTESGHDVQPLPTAAALRFVGAATWEALSGHPVSSEVWADVPEVRHVRLGREADLVVVAPATADLLARAAHGRADDVLTATLLTARCPVLYAPAMHTEMWEHPATRDNVATLRARGAVVVDPGRGRLTGADSGPGRLPEPAELAELSRLLLARPAALPRDLVDARVLISAGGTREPLDPVRFLGNRSSGRQAWALASVAAARGADVTLVAAHVDLPAPAGARIVQVGTAAQLQEAMLDAAPEADIVVMAAAVADFRPRRRSGLKIKKDGGQPPPIELELTADVLRELVARRRTGQVGRSRAQLIVGFAAETGDATGDVLGHGRAKLAAKGCDLLVVNAVGEGRAFEADTNEAVILGADGTAVEVAHARKAVLAAAVWDAVAVRSTPGAG